MAYKKEGTKEPIKERTERRKEGKEGKDGKEGRKQGRKQQRKGTKERKEGRKEAIKGEKGRKEGREVRTTTGGRGCPPSQRPGNLDPAFRPESGCSARGPRAPGNPYLRSPGKKEDKNKIRKGGS
jgi:hypothetical protein